MSKTAFVTGATGFVGLNLVETLLEQGWRVLAMHRPGSELDPLTRFAGVECVVADVTNLQAVRRALPEQVDCVFHAAGNTSLWTRARVEQLKVNVRGTRNVVRASLDRRAKRLVHVSSIFAYGLHGGTITEDTPTCGSCTGIHYVRSKALAEREVHKGIAAGLSAVTVNPANLIGRYDTANWARLFRLVRQGRLPAMPPGGGSFCHAREAARMMVVAAEKGQVGHNYLLGGAQTSYIGLVREIARLLGVRRWVIRAPPIMLKTYASVEEWLAPLFGREPDITVEAVALLSQNIYCSSRKAQLELGFRPASLEMMLEECRDWLLASNRI